MSQWHPTIILCVSWPLYYSSVWPSPCVTGSNPASVHECRVCQLPLLYYFLLLFLFCPSSCARYRQEEEEGWAACKRRQNSSGHTWKPSATGGAFAALGWNARRLPYQPCLPYGPWPGVLPGSGGPAAAVWKLAKRSGTRRATRLARKRGENCLRLARTLKTALTLPALPAALQKKLPRNCLIPYGVSWLAAAARQPAASISSPSWPSFLQLCNICIIPAWRHTMQSSSVVTLFYSLLLCDHPFYDETYYLLIGLVMKVRPVVYPLPTDPSVTRGNCIDYSVLQWGRQTSHWLLVEKGIMTSQAVWGCEEAMTPPHVCMWHCDLAPPVTAIQWPISDNLCILLLWWCVGCWVSIEWPPLVCVCIIIPLMMTVCAFICIIVQWWW